MNHEPEYDDVKADHSYRLKWFQPSDGWREITVHNHTQALGLARGLCALEALGFPAQSIQLDERTEATTATAWSEVGI